MSHGARVAGPGPGQGGGGGLPPGQGHAGAEGNEADHDQRPGQPHHIRVSHTRYSEIQTKALKSLPSPRRSQMNFLNIPRILN